MKKIIIIVLLLALMFFPAEKNAFAEYLEVTSPQNQIKQILTDFIGENPDRTSFGTNDSTGERGAAEYLVQRLSTLESARQGKIELQEFEAEFTVDSGSIFIQPKTETRYSQNVIYSIEGKSQEKIIIGCNYDSYYRIGVSEGAMDNGSGVAICLYLAETLSGLELDYSVDIAFFGAGFHSFRGSDEYIKKSGLADVILMLNVSRIGGDYTYVYAGESKTKLEGNIIARGEYKPLPNSLPLLNLEFIKGYPYTHYGMIGNHATFMGRGVPTASFFGAYYGGFNLDDREGSSYILYKDTVKNMEEAYPDCYEKMASVATTMIEIVTDSSISSVLTKISKPFLLTSWLGYLLLGLIIALGYVFFNTWGKNLKKKYPPAAKPRPAPVFGSEYEK